MMLLIDDTTTIGETGSGCEVGHELSGPEAGAWESETPQERLLFVVISDLVKEMLEDEEDEFLVHPHQIEKITELVGQCAERLNIDLTESIFLGEDSGLEVIFHDTNTKRRVSLSFPTPGLVEVHLLDEQNRSFRQRTTPSIPALLSYLNWGIQA
ncbi:MAG: hypothetical protein KC800_23715 [Candidatus Eremiobacteraeota bacterium]|nr:hypothetical protein [Candidatus Eremiobacteraeota bacterium]